MSNTIAPFIPLAISLISSFIILWLANWLLLARHADLGGERKFPRQLIMLALNITAIIIAILTLPISDSSRNQLLALMGLVISGIIAFSSTTIVSNLMAGVLLRITKPFRIGDFVSVGNHFGRISERGLFDTEIQTESRELVSLPNSYFVNNPVTTTRSSGTIISQNLSLGYDLHHASIEPLLIRAAEQAGLTEPFVQITQLGDFSVNYRVAGFLGEVKQLITARSNLCREILDVLHGANVEIVSPSFMNQRPQNSDQKTIPRHSRPAVSTDNETNNSGSDLAFDKAEEAEKTESRREKLKADIALLVASLKDAAEPEKSSIKTHIESKTKLLEALDQQSKKNSESR